MLGSTSPPVTGPAPPTFRRSPSNVPSGPPSPHPVALSTRQPSSAQPTAIPTTQAPSPWPTPQPTTLAPQAQSDAKANSAAAAGMSSSTTTGVAIGCALVAVLMFAGIFFCMRSSSGGNKDPYASWVEWRLRHGGGAAVVEGDVALRNMGANKQVADTTSSRGSDFDHTAVYGSSGTGRGRDYSPSFVPYVGSEARRASRVPSMRPQAYGGGGSASPSARRPTHMQHAPAYM